MATLHNNKIARMVKILNKIKIFLKFPVFSSFPQKCLELYTNVDNITIFHRNKVSKLFVAFLTKVRLSYSENVLFIKSSDTHKMFAKFSHHCLNRFCHFCVFANIWILEKWQDNKFISRT